MGRRAIYKTVEEKIEARRQQNRKHVRAFRARKAVEIAQIKWRLPAGTLPTQESVRSLDWQIDEYEIRAEYITEPVETPESRAIEVTPRKWRLPPETLLHETAARPSDCGSECIRRIVEMPQSRAVACSSSTVRQLASSPPSVCWHYVSPRDTPVDYTSSLMNGLFEDFVGSANFDHKNKPRIQQIQYSRLVNPYPTLALCAVMVGWSRGDRSLLRLASESYQRALEFVRARTGDVHLKSSALTLVIAVADLCNYELAVLFRNSHVIKSASAAWSRHFDAGQRIIEYAGPQSFTSDLARQTVLVTVKSIVARALAKRTSTFMASAEWSAYLEAMPQTAHADRLWPVALKVPGLMQQADILFMKQPDISALLLLLEQIDEVGSSLEFWLDTYKQGVAKAFGTYWSSTSPPSALEVELSPAIDFVTVSEAEVMMTYWAYKLELSMLREEVEAFRVTTWNRPAPTSSSKSCSHRFASLIGRSVAYWLRHVSADVCLFRLLYAIRLAWAWFARDPEQNNLEISACRAFRAKMESASKTRMAEFVMDLFYKPPPG